ncbi:MAG: hypothetical protein CAPSK01_003595 [Candidatus Accumulibacter vicinus]|uniref:Uncharacterized protein n=1 Tax=Candidatus Accumulibacter vicinus TaxID=2954382 RepID=A0A084XX84_9PROT|nr:MAG: hypothetical protein CAPSK01_003595 [Candidatus Accumulibacter vicinus]
MALLLDVGLVQFSLDAFLLARQPVQRGIEVVLIERLHRQHIGHRVLFRPAYRRQPRATMRDTRENQEQVELAFRSAAQYPRDAHLVGQLLECKQHPKNLAAGHLSRPVVEFALHQTFHGDDSFRCPVRQIGDGSCADFASLAIGLAKQDGRPGLSVGDAGDVHADNNSQ